MTNPQIAIHNEVQTIKCRAATEINDILQRAYASASLDPNGADASFFRDEILVLVTSEATPNTFPLIR